ncbi:MAG TPA: TVP38/TMEM64 family protein [Nitrospinota bacterium]|nr:TVP38/TMEM64 family protein [Nitrospinota bacterium]|tara:strand:- start:87387 stop:88112 length:726 start_codon:yes stop_codon:yes gene_type:complete
MLELPGETAPSAQSHKLRKRKIYLKLATFALIITLAVAIFYTTGVNVYFQQNYLDKLVTDMGIWAPLGYLFIYIVATLLGVPGTILSIIGGIAFGPYLGTLLIVIGATLGACGAFILAKFLIRDFIENKFGNALWFKKLDDGMKNNGLNFVLFIRLVPVFPFNAINYAFGLTNVRLRDYLIGTFIGIIPASFVYANAASKASDAVIGGEIGAGFYISLILLAIIVAMPLCYKLYKTYLSRR